MIKLLFYHRSPLIAVIEALGAVAIVAVGVRAQAIGSDSLTWFALAAVIAEYLFIRYCATRRWHANAQRYEGIELQFKKGMVPTAYIILIGSALFQFIPHASTLIIMAILLAVVGHVNVILLYLKRRDREQLPVNYFSHNKF